MLRAIYWGIAIGLTYGALTAGTQWNQTEGLVGIAGFLGGSAVGGGLLVVGVAALRNYWLFSSVGVPQSTTEDTKAYAELNPRKNLTGSPEAPRVNWQRGMLRLWAAVAALLVLCGALIGGAADWLIGVIIATVASLILLALGALGAWVAQGFFPGPK
jgi:hypothetical protein